MSEVAELERTDIAELEQEDFDKLKEKVEKAEDGEEITLGDEPDPKPDDKDEDPKPDDKDEDPKPDDKDEDPKPDDKDEDPKPDDVNQLLDQYLSDVQNKQDLSKFSAEQMQKIIHAQNKRLDDKDGFIDVLKTEKKAERRDLNETINTQKAEYEKKLSERMSKDDLNDLYQSDPMEAIDKKEQYKQEDLEAQTQIAEADRKSKRLYNEEQLMVIDRRADVKFKELVPEMKQVLKGMNQFTDEQIENFAKDPYLEDLEVLMELRDKALGIKERQTPATNTNPDPEPTPNDKVKQEIAEKKNDDLADKINKAQNRPTSVRGTGSKAKEADVLGNLTQTSTGKFDLTNLSRDELAKLKKQL